MVVNKISSPSFMAGCVKTTSSSVGGMEDVLASPWLWLLVHVVVVDHDLVT